MSGIQFSSLSDEEFERRVYMQIGQSQALPADMIKELAYRTSHDREKEQSLNSLNPKQLPLPL